MLNPEFWQFYGVVLAILCGWSIVALLLALFIGRIFGLNNFEGDPEEVDMQPIEPR